MLIYEVCFNLDTLVFILKLVKELICGFKKEEEKKNKLVCAALIIKISNGTWNMRVFYWLTLCKIGQGVTIIILFRNHRVASHHLFLNHFFPCLLNN